LIGTGFIENQQLLPKSHCVLLVPLENGFRTLEIKLISHDLKAAVNVFLHLVAGGENHSLFEAQIFAGVVALFYA